MSDGNGIGKPRVVRDGFQAAHEAALSGNEPVFAPVGTFVDDRGWSLMNLLTGVLSPEGQVNVSTQDPGVVKAWHRHQAQTDFWLCARGRLKVGVHRESDGASWMLVTGEHKPGVVVIPPPLWHGAATVGAAPATLIYYVTKAYNAQRPDEERRAHDSVAGFPWEVQHG